jgi:teichuronic acid biosynthesis glycosyltransferase TuaH
MRVVLISLEPWDGTWRRNQHLVAELMRQQLVSQVWFVEPAQRGLVAPQRTVMPGVVAGPAVLRRPKTLGGLAGAGQQIRQNLVTGSDLLWVNDPALGVHCLDGHTPAVYDVTDDWSTAGFPARIRRRIERAEARLAREAATVVCSPTLQQRWLERHDVRADLVPNGIDGHAWQAAVPRQLDGPAPHVGYVGTLHQHRLDVDLVARLAQDPRVGTLHLVGPNHLAPAVSRRLRAAGAVIHGAVPASDVPGWMLGMDVLISPHLVDDFTQSLDAIKAHEYAASGRPVVATPTSGFQSRPGCRLVSADNFADAVGESAQTPAPPVLDEPVTWQHRAAQFAAAAGLLTNERIR